MSRVFPIIAFQIQVGVLGKNIFRIVIDEGTSTCIMYISCWRAIRSSSLITYQTILKVFDGHSFWPHGIIAALPIELGGKTISMEVEIVNAPLTYNLLLGRTWFYEMKAVTSSVFRVVHFPHLGKVVTIDQLDYCTPDLRTNANTTKQFVADSPRGYASVMNKACSCSKYP